MFAAQGRKRTGWIQVRHAGSLPAFCLPDMAECDRLFREVGEQPCSDFGMKTTTATRTWKKRASQQVARLTNAEMDQIIWEINQLWKILARPQSE
jgi:hypothetical protein